MCAPFVAGRDSLGQTSFCWLPQGRFGISYSSLGIAILWFLGGSLAAAPQNFLGDAARPPRGSWSAGVIFFRPPALQTSPARASRAAAKSGGFCARFASLEFCVL